MSTESDELEGLCIKVRDALQGIERVDLLVKAMFIMAAAELVQNKKPEISWAELSDTANEYWNDALYAAIAVQKEGGPAA